MPKWLDRWRNWRKKKNQQQGELVADVSVTALREFVYLDDLSITSLLSSRAGALATEITDTDSESLKAEINAALEANAAVAKSKLGSKFEASSSSNSQIVRKMNVQASFKTLYDEEVYALGRSAVAMVPVLRSDEAPSMERLRAFLDSGGPLGELELWVIPLDELRRGRLFEIEVELEADPAYQVNAFISVLSDLITNSALIRRALNDESNLATMVELRALLDKFMQGLVPLKCRVVDYQLVTSKGRQYLIHRRLLSNIDRFEAKLEGRDIFLTGVAEHDLFWRDVRRVLFDGANFRVFGRLKSSGITSEWTPVVIVNVIEKISPEIRKLFDSLGPGLLDAAMASQGGNGMQEHQLRRMRALMKYVELLVASAELGLTEDDQIQLEELASSNVGSMVNVAGSRDVFKLMSGKLEELSGIEIENSVKVSFRQEVMSTFSLYPTPPGAELAITAPGSSHLNREPQYLDAEIIAIYW